MRISIDLFKNKDILDKSKKINSKAKLRNFKISCSPTEYIEKVKGMVKTPSVLDHLYNIEELALVGSVDKEERYDKFSYFSFDPWNELERLGLGTYARKYTCTLSMEDSLAFILSYLSGCDESVIKSMDNYFELSRGIMKMSPPYLGNFSVNKLLNVDHKLDVYLNEVYLKSEQNTEDFALTLFCEIYDVVEKTLDYLTSFITVEYGRQIAIASRGLSSVVVYSDIELPTEFELKYEDRSLILCNYNYRKFEYGEYLERRFEA